MTASSPSNTITQLHKSISRVIVGKDEVIDLLLTCLLAEGHVLIEDVPGVGKTTLASALAKSIEGTFQRIQFTSDLLPSDLIGVNVFHKNQQEFEFHPGPLFANVVVADEINRSTPKTQSALLEAMQEGQISVDRQTHILPKPFMVIATQNPIEHHGTYPLPESQLDRFLMKLHVGYPNIGEEAHILTNALHTKVIKSVEPVCSAQQIKEIQQLVTTIKVDDAITRYLIEVVHRTRGHQDVELGVSPRGSIALYKACQAFAMVRGRDYVIPDDVKKLAMPVLEHRIVSVRNKRSAASIVDAILNQTQVPM